ncbi:MAG: aminotransferase class I/II-fold pyridoxal phosphate-dependent enzyme, partial [Gammaproteobacteria bacterium]|nr:aminotransferase class I/II-fold pyridoxal phosphate-dependent enzyme [Gammaproteobacteria bacterium]
RPYIYTTAMSPLNALAIRQALQWNQSEAGEAARAILQQHIQQFRTGAAEIGLSLWDAPSAIQPLLLGSSQTALEWSEQLKQQGLWVSAIRPPTVPVGQARLRITLSASHAPEHIAQLLAALKTIHAKQ